VHIPTPSLGDIVTFSYETSARRELPVQPEIYRTRTDVSWQDVVLNYAKEQKYRNGTNFLALLFAYIHAEYFQTVSFTTKPRGYWAPDNMRAFLVHFAKSLKMDPLQPDTWYNIPFKQIYETKVPLSYLSP
jgi:hypothetical protein